MKGIRGAASIEANTPTAILSATRDMLQEIVRRNSVQPSDIVAALFTLTPDLNAAFPAAAARDPDTGLGWRDVPMMCAQEIPVPGALPGIVRVLLFVERTGPVHHVYLGRARSLRPDLAEEGVE